MKTQGKKSVVSGFVKGISDTMEKDPRLLEPWQMRKVRKVYKVRTYVDLLAPNKAE